MCGVRTNLRMPDVMSIGLGGGSVVAATGVSAALGGGAPQQRGPQPQEEEEEEAEAAAELGAARAEEAIGAAARAEKVIAVAEEEEEEEEAVAAAELRAARAFLAEEVIAVAEEATAAGWGVMVGPQSVGNRLLEECVHGGGGTYVATDLAVDLDRLTWFGPAAEPDAGLSPSLGTLDRRLPLARAGWEVGPATQGQHGGWIC